MGNKKIAFLINSLTNGGAERVVSNVISFLEEEGHSVELICLEKNDFYSVGENVRITYLSDVDGQEKSLSKLLILLLFSFRLKSHIKDNDISLVQSHLFRANYVNVLSKLFGSRHIVQLVSTVSANSKYSSGSVASKVNLFLIDKLYKYADTLIFKSFAMRDGFVGRFNLRNKNVIINNPVDIGKINTVKRNDVDHKFVFDSDKRFIISIGRFHEQKRQRDLVDAFLQVEKRYPDLRVIFLGDGEEREKVQRYVENIGISNKISFLGNVKNPYYYLSHSYLYVSTSSSEGFPNALVEAMVCGVPVVSTDCLTGPREILSPDTDHNGHIYEGIEEGQYGVLVPIGEKKMIARAIAMMAGDSVLYCRYRRLVRERASDFSMDRIIEKYKHVLGL